MKLKPSTLETYKAEKYRAFIERQYRKDVDLDEVAWIPLIVTIIIALLLCCGPGMM